MATIPATNVVKPSTILNKSGKRLKMVISCDSLGGIRMKEDGRMPGNLLRVREFLRTSTLKTKIIYTKTSTANVETDVSMSSSFSLSVGRSKLMNAVVMGNNTFAKLGNKPLSDRFNYVLSNNNLVKLVVPSGELSGPMFSNTRIKTSIVDAFTHASTNNQVESVIVVGGETLYNETLETCVFDDVILVQTKKDCNCDKRINYDMFTTKILNNPDFERKIEYEDDEIVMMVLHNQRTDSECLYE